MPNRPAIPAEVTREILIESGHRCAVCGTPCPLERAHIIPWHQTKQHEAEDLICLCANCHQRADQENWGEKTLREYKRKPWVLRHYENVEGVSGSVSRLKLTIGVDYKDFDEKSQRLLQFALAAFLDIPPAHVQLEAVERGSVKVTVRLPAHSAEELVNAYKRNDPELAKHLAPLVLLDFRPVGRRESIERETEIAKAAKQSGVLHSTAPREKRLQLDERDQHVLWLRRRHISDKGYPPTEKEIALEMEVASTSTVRRVLDKLRKLGHIVRESEVARRIRLTATSSSKRSTHAGPPVRIPLLGRIVAGAPLPTPGSDMSLMPDETIELPRGILEDPEGLYALQVEGNSMVDVLVRDGDIVVMRHQQRVENGEMAAVWLREREEVTLKQFYQEAGGRVRLQPANPTMRPIYVDDPRQVEVQGKVVMVIRQLEWRGSLSTYGNLQASSVSNHEDRAPSDD